MGEGASGDTAADVRRQAHRQHPDQEQGDKRVGSLVLYRSGGTTCAMTKHGGASWGKKRFTGIMLVGCKTAKAGKDCGEAPFKEDKGQFAYQAGPVRVKSGNRCVWARALRRRPGRQAALHGADRRKYRGATAASAARALAGRARTGGRVARIDGPGRSA